MHWILIMFLAGGGQLESGVKHKTLAECEAAGQYQMRGQSVRNPFYANYVCKQKGKV